MIERLNLNRENRMPLSEKFAVVTGASTGIGLELARCCVHEGYDVLIAADEPQIESAATELRAEGGGGKIDAVQADLSTTEGVDKLYSAAQGRAIDILMANAGRGLGRAFLDQDFDKARKVIDTNVTGTVYLLHKLGNECGAGIRGVS
jgi:short-subunit dehydrogenase